MQANPEYNDPQYQLELWYMTDHNDSWIKVDRFFEKDPIKAREWLDCPIPTSGEDIGSVFEKRILYKDSVDCIAMRRFRIEALEKTILEKIDF